MTQKNQAAQDPLELQGELVPLRVAASIAYFHITDPVRQASSRDDLDEILHLVAIALSTAAPIQRLDGSVLTDAGFHLQSAKPRINHALGGFARHIALLRHGANEINREREGARRDEQRSRHT